MQPLSPVRTWVAQMWVRQRTTWLEYISHVVFHSRPPGIWPPGVVSARDPQTRDRNNGGRGPAGPRPPFLCPAV